MSKKGRTKSVRRSEEILGRGIVADHYALGVIGPDPRRTSALVALLLAVAIALSFILFGAIIIPGVLFIVVLFAVIDRPASVAVTDRGVAVLARSEVNGRPRKLLAVLPQGVLADRTVVRSGSYVHLPDFHLWFRTKEYERLLGSAEGELIPNSWAPPVAAGIGARNPGTPPAPHSPTGSTAVASLSRANRRSRCLCPRA